MRTETFLIITNNYIFSDKNGVPTSEAADLVKFIITDCTSLEFSGLMTIGALNHSLANGENPDFLVSSIYMRNYKIMCKTLTTYQ
jgi:uncharacterized pyridoxal phosphate-containing UPF0001 family protein